MSAAKKLQDEWLLSYAAGALDPARSVMVSTHLAYHDDLQESVANIEAIGGTLLESIDQSSVSEDALDSILSKLDQSSVPEIKPVASNSSRFPQPLMEFLDCDINKLDWRFMGPGMSNARLWEGPNQEKLSLLRARGGIMVPEHGHSGEEWTLVLNGSYVASQNQFARGDIELADDDVEHQPIIDQGEECICLVFTSGALQFKSLAARAAQPFIGL